MKAFFDFGTAAVFAIPLVAGHVGPGGATVREGMLIEGPQGWGEFSPPRGVDLRADVRWLTAAVEPGTVGWPDTLRGRIPVSVAVPDVDPVTAHRLVSQSGCATADVTVGSGSVADDAARLEAVRDALGPGGAVRCDAGARWDVDTAAATVATLTAAAGGLDFVERPCRTVEELTLLRRRTDVPVAIRVDDPDPPDLTDAADVVVLSPGPLGGVRRALRVAERVGLPCVVASAVETSIGLSAGLALAGALPELTYACALGTRTWLTADVTTPGRSLVPVDGLLPVAPMPPGPDPDSLAACAVRDPDVLAWWRERLRAADASI